MRHPKPAAHGPKSKHPLIEPDIEPDIEPVIKPFTESVTGAG